MTRDTSELDRLRAAYFALLRHLRDDHGIDPPGTRAHLDAAHMAAHHGEGTPWHRQADGQEITP